MSISQDTRDGAILGAVLGAIIIPFVLKCLSLIFKWWRESRPAHRLLQGAARQSEPCKVFIRDLILEHNATVIAVEPRVGIGRVPNVKELWPQADAQAAACVFSILGSVGKTQNVEIVRMSEDPGQWDSHVVVIGAQAAKSFDFYRHMKNVAFRVDGQNIIDQTTDELVQQEKGYGYGIILKATNPFKKRGRKGVAFLIGGFGAPGTAAAGHYLRENFRSLGRTFGRSDFGIVVRTSITAGEQAVERLPKWDRVLKGP